MDKVRISEESLRKLIIEELSKSEVQSMIRNEILSKLDSQELKKKVKEISAEVVSNLFKTLWQQNNMWRRACQQ